MDFPSFDLTGQVALVTGAARGLGRAISLALAHAGADVALGLRDRKMDSGLTDELRAMGRRVLPLQMDMTKLEEVQWAVAETAREFGRLDILVNNAGLGPENPAEKVREEDFDLTVAVNLKGTFFCEPGGGARDDPAGKREDYQYEFASGIRGAADGIDLLHDEGGDCAFDEMPGRGVGEARHYGECGGTDVYSDAGDGGGAGGFSVSRGHD